MVCWRGEVGDLGAIKRLHHLSTMDISFDNDEAVTGLLIKPRDKCDWEYLKMH